MRKHLLLIFFLLATIVCQAQTVYKTKTGSKYHTASCRYLKSSFETTIAAAQAEGLTACSVCSPGMGSSSGSTLAPANKLVNTGSSSSSGSSNRASGSVQCSGTTKAGTRCKRMTTDSSGRCYQH